MSVYEKEYSDCTYICGIDEVGRGPFAGPVVAGAVILPKDDPILYLNDSKKLSEKKREALYDEIMERAVATGIGIVSPARIDEINILQATYEAMRMAIGNLKVEPDLLLNDAVTIPGVDIRQVPIIKGDAQSVSIAAASIIAKVTRDRLMVEYDAVMPGYDFAANKGYGTKKHIEGMNGRTMAGDTGRERKNNRETGSHYERLAGAYLEQEGYEILEYNYRCKTGEIDIIAREAGYLVFCEVKYRASDKKGHPAEAVNPAKQRTISKSALCYMTVNGIDEVPCRFDVVSIENHKVILYRNAFDYTG